MKSFVGPGWDMGLKQTRDLSDGWAAGTEGSCRSWQAEVWVPAWDGQSRGSSQAATGFGAAGASLPLPLRFVLIAEQEKCP